MVVAPLVCAWQPLNAFAAVRSHPVSGAAGTAGKGKQAAAPGSLGKFAESSWPAARA